MPIENASLQQNGSMFLQYHDNNTWDISNELNVISRKSGRNITEFNSFIQYQNSPENLNIVPGLHDSIFNSSVPYYKLTQRVKLRSFFTQESFSYRVVTNYMVQNYKVGVLLQSQLLGSNLSTENNSGSVKQLSDSFLNNLTWRQSKVYIKSDYDMIYGSTRLSVSLPLNLHSIQKTNTVSDFTEKFTRIIFSPSVNCRYNLNGENNISANYQYNSLPSGIQENYPNYILSNYMLLQKWDLPIVTNSRHTVNIGWSGTKAGKLLTGNVSLTFKTGENGYLPSYYYSNILQVRQYFQGTVKNNTSLLNAGISKYLFSTHSTISSRVILQKTDYEQIQQNRLSRFSDFRQTLSARIQTKMTSWMTGFYTIAFTSSKSKNRTYDSIPVQKTSHVVQQFEINVFPLSRLSIRLTGENYYSTRNESPFANVFFADAHIVLGLGKSKTELSLDATNITGKNDYTFLTIGGNNSQQVNFPLRPFQVLATIKFQF